LKCKLFIGFCIFILVLTIYKAAADDIETYYPQSFSDVESYSKPILDNETNHFWSKEEEEFGGGGGGGANSNKIIYDVIVITKTKYYGGFNNKAQIVIKNMGDFFDRDTTLKYYVVDKNNFTYGESLEQILRVPPISSNASTCKKYGGQIDITTHNCITILYKNINLPFNSHTGEYKFYAEYTTLVQPKIIAYSSFNYINTLVFFISIGLVFFILIISFIIAIIYKRNQSLQQITTEVVENVTNNN
jgi:hypothetical protein